MKELDSDGRSYLTCLIGLPPGGRERWEKALAGAKGSALAGRALAMLGRDAEALAVLDKAVARDAKDAEAWAWRGEAHLLAGRLDPARRDLDRAAELATSWPWARILRAVTMLSVGDVAGASAELAKTDAPEAAVVAALVEGQRGQAAQGVATLAKADSGPAYAVRALLKLGLGDLPGGLADIQEAAKLEPSAWVLMRRADALNRSGFYRDALKDAFKAAELLPGVPEPRLQAANIYFDQAFYPEALEHMEAALACSPDDAALLARRARFHLLLGRLEEAEAGLDRALKSAPGDGQLVYERLNVIALRGRYDEVLKAIKRARCRRRSTPI
ncbi:MAG: tetratricopeptide repeat protein [Elusimicrobiota bacterium]|nr:MAG: tetratricopeptide repeat protein [Elusimicrobiota bacterium]